MNQCCVEHFFLMGCLWDLGVGGGEGWILIWSTIRGSYYRFRVWI